jgi:hypothetical protein
MLSQSSEAAALLWVNSMRALGGVAPLDALPAGERGASRACPLALGTGMTIAGAVAYSDDGPCIRLPRRVAAFALAFDQGKLPAFEAAHAPA